jgi:beta-lactamase regulating signal transducer with metallopeptidase domain
MALLLKWTWLLAMGWAAHLALRRHHARWRLILWRGILCLGLALPLAHFLRIPAFQIPIAGAVSPGAADDPTQQPAFAGQLPETPQSEVGDSPISSGAAREGTRGTEGTEGTQGTKGGDSRIASGGNLPGSAGASHYRIAGASAHLGIGGAHRAPLHSEVPWGSVLLLTWALGCGCGAFRLLRLHLQLFRLRKETCRPSPDLRQLARQIQVRLKAGREVDIQISEAVTSPFLCGLFNPAIILPPGLAQQLSEGELVALLSHEIAHLRQNDLAWCVAWRWMKAFFWFHPLVWKVPAVHNLACEQEADRVASRLLAEEESYSRLLARLALRVLALPAVETKLTLNGSSQIAWRLIHLGQKGTDAWNWKHSAAGLGLVGLLFLMTAGFDFSKAGPAGLAVKMVQSGQVLTMAQASAAPEAVSAGRPVEPEARLYMTQESAASEAVSASKSGPPLTIDLRDGSHFVGRSLKDTLNFRSPMMGDFKLKWPVIRSIEYAGTNADLARLTATNGDLFVITLAADALPVQTVFGQIVLPVELIRSVRAPEAGNGGLSSSTNMTESGQSGSSSIATNLFLK